MVDTLCIEIQKYRLAGGGLRIGILTLPIFLRKRQSAVSMRGWEWRSYGGPKRSGVMESLTITADFFQSTVMGAPSSLLFY